MSIMMNYLMRMMFIQSTQMGVPMAKINIVIMVPRNVSNLRRENIQEKVRRLCLEIYENVEQKAGGAV